MDVGQRLLATAPNSRMALGIKMLCLVSICQGINRRANRTDVTLVLAVVGSWPQGVRRNDLEILRDEIFEQFYASPDLLLGCFILALLSPTWLVYPLHMNLAVVRRRQGSSGPDWSETRIYV